ncbi:MAG: NFYB/HAP3 family transcription factor subunit [Candidatus Micrarchaeota archaeon]|nr:NFYB/HAP3 family transcription factor subunit [Candidatus Micrarchaeota archaeon]
MTISKMAAKRILKSVGGDRISESAVVELSETLNAYAYSIAKKAVKLAKHAKRKTVKKADIELAR